VKEAMKLPKAGFSGRQREGKSDRNEYTWVDDIERRDHDYNSS